ncbi:MAG: helix-turn-helix domain-containing protein [Spirochaetaceae bacterium]|jgi:transcriptional regulator with XRE-family HTH domain|nr:helix-turn-helix domain-containing protein [Spirochaetaceae bacterium]
MIKMTRFQELFIKNLRFLRKKKGISQLAFSEKIGVSPNYLNAVENGKNFPSPDIIQKISDSLGILPYQLFLEYPLFGEGERKGHEKEMLIQELTILRGKLLLEIDMAIEKCQEKPGNI